MAKRYNESWRFECKRSKCVTKIFASSKVLKSVLMTTQIFFISNNVVSKVLKELNRLHDPEIGRITSLITSVGI